MKIQIFYLFLLLVVFEVVLARKSGLYNENVENDDDSDEEYIENENDVENVQEVNENDYAYDNDNVEEVEVEVNTNEQGNYNNNESTENNQNNSIEDDNSIFPTDFGKLKTKHEYKLSFKKPYYYYNDTEVIPNWKYFGGILIVIKKWNF